MNWIDDGSKFKQFYFSKWLVALLLAFGALLRTIHYLANRSLWFDEASLALNIINRSYVGLMQPLEHRQSAPVGFLFIERTTVNLFVNNEYVLRLFPFLCSLLSLWLFYLVVRHYLQPIAVPIALLFFSILDQLIYYAAELKPYSCDVTITLLLFVMAISIEKRGLTWPQAALFGLLGGLLLFISYTAVFVLAGIGSALILIRLRQQNWVQVQQLGVMAVSWLGIFLLLYITLFRTGLQSEFLKNYWQSGFIPFPPLNLAEGRRLLVVFYDVFSEPLELEYVGLAAFAFLAGLISLGWRNKQTLLLLLLPILFALIASRLRTYPFNGRLILFLVPILLIFIIEGVVNVVGRYGNYWITVVLVLVLVRDPIQTAVHRITVPDTNHKEEIAPNLDVIAEGWQDGDILFLYFGAERAYLYYQQSRDYPFKSDDVIRGAFSRDDVDKYIADIDALRGQERVWVLFSHIYRGDGINEEEFYLDYLDTVGERLLAFEEARGSDVYLYDLSNAARKD